MNVVVVLMDSLNRHCLEPYGGETVRTPNLARLGRRAHVFDNHFIGSMPCMPARRELITGRSEFLWRGWGHIEPWDRHLAVDAAQAGAATQMITDHYHYWENGAHGYFEPFHGVEMIRGHELDMVETNPVTELPEWARAIDAYRGGPVRSHAGWGSLYCANVQDWRGEADYSSPRTLARGADWLARNRGHEQFLLWVETFDPHEPFHVPEPYSSMYVEGAARPDYNCWPPYQNAAEMHRFLAEASDAELAWIRAQYYGNVTLNDAWLGRILDRFDELNLWDDTALILTTDHGHDLAYDRQLHPHPWGKQYPHAESHARIPLLIWDPRHPGDGQRIAALTCAVDINATIRDLLDCPEPDGPHGRSLAPLLAGEREHHRDWVLYGTWGQGATLTTPDWTLAQGARGDEPLFWYSTTSLRVSPDMTSGCFVPGVDIPQWRVPARGADTGSYLWRREPFSLTPENLIEREPAVAGQMRELLRAAIEEVGAPPETYARLGLGAA